MPQIQKNAKKRKKAQKSAKKRKKCEKHITTPQNNRKQIYLRFVS